MTHLRFLVLLWTIVLLTQPGCKKNLPNPATPAPPVKDAGPPPSEDEAKDFVDRMNKAVQADDAAAIDQLVRMKDFLERVVIDMELSNSERQSFLKGATSSLRQAGMGPKILQSIEGGGSYKLLNIRTVNGQPRPLFRLVSADGTFNYHEYILTRYSDGDVATEDIYVYYAGEPLSQTMRRIIIPILQTLQGKGVFRKIDPQEINNLKSITAIGKAIRDGDNKSAIAIYRSIPKKYQEQKPYLLLYLQATMLLGTDGEADYLNGIETFRRLYPNDPALAFISIDYFILKGRYDEARKSIDQIDKSVGGDPFLDSLRGKVWMEAGRFEEASRAIERVIEKEPNLTPVYWARITVSLREKKHADTLKWLKIVVEKFQIEIEDLKDSPDYADFVKSPQHGEWQEWYAKQSKGGDKE